jgi:hypothetical protein
VVTAGDLDRFVSALDEALDEVESGEIAPQ